jgi:hypothetical protein
MALLDSRYPTINSAPHLADRGVKDLKGQNRGLKHHRRRCIRDKDVADIARHIFHPGIAVYN